MRWILLYDIIISYMLHVRNIQLSSKPNIGQQRDVGDIFCAMPQVCEEM